MVFYYAAVEAGDAGARPYKKNVFPTSFLSMFIILIAK
jgi:hypothetical protein